MRSKEEIRRMIDAGQAVLGIELGSTRIKAVLIDTDKSPVASGSYDWENQYVNHIWTYDINEVWKGLQGCYSDLVKNVREEYGVTIKDLAAIGISAMMHGYLAFDEKDELLVPFRTWRNTITGEASEKLSELFSYHIPQRWSIAHLYQAILNGEEHVDKVRFFTTLSGYIHWMLTGRKVLGSGDAAGMFPMDIASKIMTAGCWTSLTRWLRIKASSGRSATCSRKCWLPGKTQGASRRRGQGFSIRKAI